MADVFHARYFAPRRPARGPGRGAFAAAVLLHLLPLVALVGNVFDAAEPLPQYKVYRVDIYSPPPQVEGKPEAPPQPTQTIVQPAEAKTVAVEQKPAPAVKKPAPPKNVTTGTGKSAVAKGRNPDPKSVVGGEGLDVHMAGEEFPYPEYLENIIIQLNRYFRWTGAPNLDTRIGFEIMRDGSVSNIRVLRKSGNINFDLEAISAIEQAGKRGAFGPLPRGWVANRLPIAFSFLPPGR
ncbi:MAG: TonB C-terminal domain-containing protein [Gemmatimonadota bacterium]